MTHGSEEAEGVIVMISDWLELDASDSWVRHDSEIVSVPLRLNLGEIFRPAPLTSHHD
jgi:protein arginine N-methyltransferase 5